MRIVLISDTHAPRRWKGCPSPVAQHLDGADLILHAGDVCTSDVLSELSSWAPVRAVLGNNDGPDIAAWGATADAELELDGVQVAMIHDSGPAGGRGPRLRRKFPNADVVVFGHSHIPLHQVQDGVHLVNPGSPTDRRRQPNGTIGELVLDHGQVVSVRILAVT